MIETYKLTSHLMGITSDSKDTVFDGAKLYRIRINTAENVIKSVLPVEVQSLRNCKWLY